MLFFLALSSAYGEGSKELIANGGNRAKLSSTLTSSEGLYFPTQGLVRVYVNNGETIYMGSSGVAVDATAEIVLISPSGVPFYNDGANDGKGNIASMAEESAGPSWDGAGGTFEAFRHTAGETGIWSVYFVESNEIEFFDVSVSANSAANSSADFIKGRAYMNSFGGVLDNYTETFQGIFYVMTNDGYTYAVDANDLAGYRFTFFSNNKGYKTTDGLNKPTYQSKANTNTSNLQDPRLPDVYNGNGSAEDVTHKLFFNLPASDLPSTPQDIWLLNDVNLNYDSPGTKGKTWMKTTPVLPVVSAVSFVGKEGTPNSGGVYPLGGTIKFSSTLPGSYTIKIDVGNNGPDPKDVTLSDDAVAGPNSIVWDGRDNQGAPVFGTLNPSSITVSLKAGEVHFPYIDVENNRNGIKITRQGGGIGTTTVYWNDSNAGGTSNLVGADSSPGAHTWGTGVYDANDFGNGKGLDTWAYLLSNVLSPTSAIQLSQADLEVQSITRSSASLCIGQQQTYTVLVKNNGPHNVTGAKFRFQYPPEFTGVVGTWSDGSLPSGSAPANTYEALIDLNDQEVKTFTITGTITGMPAGNNVAVTASILRPADVLDPDATNPDSAAPTDAQLECDAAPSGIGCNNIKLNSTAVVLSNISIASTSVTEGSTLGTTNMNFVVSLSAVNTACDVTVKYEISDFKTTNASDFNGLTSGTVTILKNQPSAIISIPLLADKVIENNESFTLRIYDPTSGQILAGQDKADGTITDDDNAPVSVVVKTDAAEPNTQGEFTVQFPLGVTSSVLTTLTYSITGTATPGAGSGADYTTLTGTVSIPIGQQSAPIVIPVLDDFIIEGTETVSVTLSSVTSSIPTTVTPGTAIAKILDDDSNSNIITLSKIDDGEEPGTPGKFRVSFPAGYKASVPTTVNYIVGGTAINGTDYTALSGSVVIPAFAEFADIDVNVTDDLIIEGDETVVLSNITAANSLGFPFAYSGVPQTLTIKDNDNINPQITVVPTIAGEPGTNGRFRISLPLNVTSTVPTTITYNFLGTSNATNGVDYSTLGTTAVIPAGANYVDVVVTVIDDKIIEGQERIDISLVSATNSNAPGLTYSAGPYSVGINDDDNAAPNNVITLTKVSDGAEPGTMIRYRVTFPVGVTSAVNTTITYTVGGSATNNVDYDTPPGTIIINQNTNGEFIDIPVKNDNISELTETITLTITSVTNSVASITFAPNNPVSADIFDDENIGPNNVITLYKINDGAEPGTPAFFRVKFPGTIVNAAPTTVTYAITGTAVNGTDYSTLTGTIVIPANVNGVDIPVGILDDKIIEGTETIALQLTSAVNTISPTLTVNPGTVVADLVDDDNDDPNNIITLTRLQDGFEGGSLARYQVSFPAGITSAVATTVSYSVSGTAVNGTDYGTLSGTVTIPAGAGSALIDLPVVDDLIIEGTETVSLILTNAANAVALLNVAPNTAVTVEIFDNDNNSPNVAMTLIRDGGEGGVNPQYRVRFPTNVTSSVDTKLNYFISGTATNGTDYTVLGGTITIPAGSNFATIDIIVNDDLIIEGNETVDLTLTGITNAVAPSMTYSPGTALTATIADNDNAAPNNVVKLTVVQHGAEGGSIPRFEVAFPAGVTSSGATVVNYSIGGTAVNGTDYANLTGTVTIPAGQNSVFIDAPVVDDPIIEGPETLELTLTSATTTCACPLTIQPGTAVIANIADNDNGGSVITLTKLTDGAEPGTTARYEVSLPAGMTSSFNTTVNYSLGGTAINGTDYNNLTGSVIIPAGAHSAFIDFVVKDDYIIEGNETVSVTLISASNPIPASSFSVSPTTAVAALIVDNDNTTPNNIVTLTRIQHGAEPGTNVVFRVGFPNAPNTITSSAPTLVSYSVSGTALTGTDFGILPGTITIPAGANFADIVVPVINDNIIEGTETVDLTLNWATNPVAGLTVNPTTAVSANIVDDDDVPPTSLVLLTAVNDGSEPSSPGQFRVSFPPGVTSSAATVLTYSVAGTATQGTDYVNLPLTVTIPAGATSALIDVLVNDDLILEGTETVSLTLNTVTNAVATNIQIAAPASASVNILDDEINVGNPATIISLSRVSNGREPGTAAVFRVSYPPGVTAAEATDVTYSIAPAGPLVAISDTDYEALSGTVTIPAGVNFALVEAKVKDDKIIEYSETITLQLLTASNGVTPLTVNNTSVTAYIEDDDNVAPYNVVSVKRVQNGAEPSSDGEFEIGFPDGYTSSELTTITYTVGGPSINGTDYVMVSGSIQILPTFNSAKVLIDIKDDLIIEGDETVTLNITGATNPIANPQVIPGTAVATIADDDNTVTNNTISLTRTNGSEPGTDAKFVVSFPTGITTTSDTYVRYTIGGTATNGVDYEPITGVVIIPAGQSSADIDIDVKDDNIIEGTEKVIITLTSASNTLVSSLTVQNAPVEADIVDDDNTGPIVLEAVSDGAEPGTHARFRVRYPAGKTRSIESVIGYIIGGTALADKDYRALTGTVRIPAGAEFAYIDPETIDDQIIEPAETITIRLNSVNATASNPVAIDATVATANVVDNDSAGSGVTLTKISDASEPGTNAVYRVSYNNGLSASTPTSINFTVGGTATSGTDFVAPSIPVTIPAEKNFVEFSVNVIDDKVIEPTEQISLTLATATNGIAPINVPATVVTASIYDDDILSKITIKNTDDGIEPSDDGMFRIGFEGTVTSLVNTTVNYVITGTALNGTDYTSISNSVVIPATQNSWPVDISVLDDKIIEGTESVVLTITSATSTIVNPDIVDGTKTVNIFDDDNTPVNNTVTLTLENHGNEPGTKAQFKVSLPDVPAALKTTSDTRVIYTIGGTATNGLDYDVLNGVAIIRAGDTFALIDVNVKDDKIIEGTETVQLRLVSAQNDLIPSLTVAPGTAVTANIDDDDDVAPNTILLLSKESDAQEPSTPGRIKLSFPTGYSSSRPTEVNYSVGGTASPNVDYQMLNGKVTIPADENFAYIDIDVIDDQLVEGPETVDIAVTSITNIAVPGVLTINPTMVTANIRDDDYATLTVSSPITIVEGDGGGQSMTFTVTLSKETQHGFQLRFNTVDGTAISAASENDFDAVSGGLVVFPGASIPPALPVLSKTFTIPIVGDKVIERDEDFQVIFEDLIDDMGGHLSFVNKAATGTILDDDNTVANKTLTITKTDGNETSGNSGQFTFSFPPGVSSDVATSIQYTLTGTAKGALATDKDYTIIQTGTITIPAYANSSAPLEIPVFDDNLIELTETVVMNAEPPVNSRYSGIVVDNNGVSLNIVDNDNATLTISGPVTHNEGDSGSITYTFTVTLDKATEDTFDVKYTTKDGTAKVGDNDYAASSDTLTFGSTGPLSQTITVVVKGDKKIESDENFTIELSPVSGTQILGGLVQIAGSPAQGIITDDDNTVNNKKITITATNGAEGGAPGRVRFSLPAGVTTDGIISIPYTFTGTAKGTGAADYDYGALPTATVTIPADSTGVTIDLPVNDDNLIEGDETVVVNASPITHDKYTGFTLNNAPQTLTIADNDNSLISISGPAPVTEGDGSTRTAVFIVTLNKPTQSGFSVDYKTIDGTATSADLDYDALPSGQLHFAAGQMSDTIKVSIRGDRVIERDETFQVELSNILPSFGGHISFSNTTATGTILDDDNTVANKTLTITKTDGNETSGNSGQFTFSFPPGVSSDVATSIQYTLTGTAKGALATDKDYTIIQTGTITIPAYANSSAPLEIPVFDDNLIELTETVVMNAEPPVNSRYSGIVVDNNGVSLNIVDNDNATLTISGPVTHNEGDSGSITYTFTVTLDKAVNDVFDVKYTTKDGTATVTDHDYATSGGTLSFGGTSSLTRDINVVVYGDKKIESNEAFTVELGPTSGTSILEGRVVISGSPAQGNITDNDGTDPNNKKILIITTNGAEGGSHARVTFKFPDGVTTDGTTTIPYTFTGSAKGTGSVDFDYGALPTGTVTIAPDSNSVTIPLPVNDDSLIEGDETVIVSASTISHDKYTGFTLTNAPQTITIADNDGAFLSISGPVTVIEGNAGSKKAIFEVTLNKGVGSGFTVGYRTADGTASSSVTENDFVTVANGTLPFNGIAGEKQYIEIDIIGDLKIERDEDFQIQLVSLSNNFGGNLQFTNTTAAGIIKDDDNLTENKFLEILTSDGAEGGANGSFIFRYPNNVLLDAPTTISYTLRGTARGGGIDYTTPVTGTVTIPAGSPFATLPILVFNDSAVESSETVILTVNSASNDRYGDIVVTNSPATLNIEDNDNATLTITGPITVNEGNTGSTNAVFRVTLSNPTGGPFTINYKTMDGTATVADNDYSSTSGTLSFSGQAGQFFNITVPVFGDLRIEQNETFGVELDGLSLDFDGRLAVSGNPAEGRILDNDNTPANKRITVTRVDGAEGGTDARFRFSFPAGVTADDNTTIAYALAGTALPNGVDYIAAQTGTIIIPPNTNSATLQLEVFNDEIIESTETAILTAGAVTNATYTGIVVTNPTLSLNITDNDTGKLVLSGPVVVTEGNTGPTLISFTVTLSAGTERPFQIGYTTQDGTATLADKDYVSKTANVSFQGIPGESQTIIFIVNGDFKIESDEEFNVMLRNLSNNFGGRLTFSGLPSKGRILNDDNGTITITKVDGKEGAGGGSFTFSLPPNVFIDKPIVIPYSLTGTAFGNDVDFAAKSISSFTIPAGLNKATLNLIIKDDAIIEPRENVILKTGLVLSSMPDAILINNSPQELFIDDNDTAPIVVTNPVIVSEGHNGTVTAIFDATLPLATSTGFTLDYSTLDGVAKVSDNDYISTSGKLTFAGTAGEVLQIKVLIKGDVRVEPDEEYFINLLNLSNTFEDRLTLKFNRVSGVIHDDDNAPGALDDIITTDEDVPVTIPLTANDTDADGIDISSISIKTPPEKGTVTLNRNGTVLYKPALNDNGTRYFSYTVKDITGLESNVARVTVIIKPVNDPPLAVDDKFFVRRDSTLRELVSRNDSDPDGDKLRFKVTTSPKKGALVSFSETDGAFIYTPTDTLFKGYDLFTYRVTDPDGLTDEAVVTLGVQPGVRVKLTPSIAKVKEGAAIIVTAVLSESLLEDVNLVLDYDGTAMKGIDYKVSGDFETMTIKAGDTTTSQELTFTSLKDFLKEGDELAEILIKSVTPLNYVAIDSGSTITITELNPDEKPVGPDENGDIYPDPYVSPNGDGLGNEQFVINNIDKYADNEVVIFNRWGNEVFRISDYNNKDRAFKGFANTGLMANKNATLPDGVYYFMIHTKVDNVAKMNKGYVIIKRQ